MLKLDNTEEEVQVQCCFTSADTVRTIRKKKKKKEEEEKEEKKKKEKKKKKNPRTATSTFTQILSSERKKKKKKPGLEPTSPASQYQSNALPLGQSGSRHSGRMGR